MKRLVILSFTLIVSLTPIASNAAVVKAGASCTKLGAYAISANKKFTCVKVGKKLQWNKGVAIAAPKPMSSPKPSTSPTQAVMPTLSEHEIVISQVSANWKLWRSKSSTAIKPIKIYLQPGYDLAWNDASKAADVLISTFVGNGFTLLQDPISIFGDDEEWLAATGRPLACGRSVPEQPLGIYCGHIQLGYGYMILNASQTDKFVGKPLSATQKNILNYMVAHDVATMYELQAQYGAINYNGSKDQIPAWIREGFVQLFAALAISDSNPQKISYFDYLASANLIDSFPKVLCSKTLQNFESKDRNWGGSCASSQNFYAVELLVARHGGLEALFKFVSQYGVTNDWTASFQSAFSVSREDFYLEWYDYLKIPQNLRPALTAPAPATRG